MTEYGQVGGLGRRGHAVVWEKILVWVLGVFLLSYMCFYEPSKSSGFYADPSPFL